MDHDLTLAASTFGFGVDASFAMMRLIMSGALDAFPGLAIILGHYGEALPFLAGTGRPALPEGADRSGRERRSLVRAAPSHYLKNNLWVTTSGNYLPQALTCSMDVLGMDKVLLGTDHPYENMKECMEFLASQPLSEGDTAKLYEQNAVRLGFSL